MLTEGLQRPETVLAHALFSALMMHVVHARLQGACVSRPALPVLAALQHRHAVCALLAAVAARSGQLELTAVLLSLRPQTRVESTDASLGPDNEEGRVRSAKLDVHTHLIGC